MKLGEELFLGFCFGGAVGTAVVFLAFLADALLDLEEGQGTFGEAVIYFNWFLSHLLDHLPEFFVFQPWVDALITESFELLLDLVPFLC